MDTLNTRLTAFELLVLVQPCTRRRYVTDTPAEGPLPDRFRWLYRYDIEPEMLERLALALGCLLADPARAATRFDALSAELAEPVVQPDRFAGLRREGEAGGLIADLDAACHALLASLRSRRIAVPRHQCSHRAQRRPP